MATPDHKVSLIVRGREVDNFTTYRITSSLTKPGNPFDISIPFDRDAWDLCTPDSTIQITIDGAPILNGRIDDRDLSPDGPDVINIVGRDKAGWLAQDCAPGINFSGLGIKDIFAKLVEPLGVRVTFTNDRNRRVMLGRGPKVKGHRKRTGAGFKGPIGVLRTEDSALRLNTRVGTQIEPGQTRWQVMQTLAAQAGYIVFLSGDGTELIVGAPDYDQETQFVLFMPREGSTRGEDATCLGLGIRDSVGDRYSRVIVIGSGTGTDANYGASTASRFGQALNDPSHPEGVGLDFAFAKTLILSRAVASQAEANELAAREMARRDAMGHVITARCAGHGQIYAGSTPTLFAPDTLALVEDERTGTAGIYLITECVYQSGRTGEETLLTLVKSGSDLTES
jgi:prophage tail gpP-like protein